MIRVIGSVLQTPVYEFDHPDTESTVGLVGMIHVGKQVYYDNVQAYVERREAAGSEVHYERVPKMTDDQKAAYPELSQLNEAFNNGIEQRIEWLKETFGIESQKTALIPPETWHNYDMTGLDLMQHLGVDGVKRNIQQSERLVEFRQNADPRK